VVVVDVRDLVVIAQPEHVGGKTTDVVRVEENAETIVTDGRVSARAGSAREIQQTSEASHKERVGAERNRAPGSESRSLRKVDRACLERVVEAALGSEEIERQHRILGQGNCGAVRREQRQTETGQIALEVVATRNGVRCAKSNDGRSIRARTKSQRGRAG
jgi:hypothetical protein